MLDVLISFAVYLIVVGLILWLIDYGIQIVPMFEPFRAVARTVISIVGCLILILLLVQLLQGGGFRVRM